MKKMATLFLFLGLLFLGLSAYFYFKKENTPSTYADVQKQKGDAFEDFIIQKLGRQNNFKFVGKVSDYHKNGISALENYEPDLKFKYKNTAFAVECKWRKSFYKGKTDWAKDRQIQNYLNYQNTKKEKVYVALGIGGKPEAPERWFLIPLFRLKLEFVTENYIKEFEVKDEEQLSSFIQ